MISRLVGTLVKVDGERAYVEAGPTWVELLVAAGDVPRLEELVGRTATFHTVFYLEGDASGGNLTPRLIGFVDEGDRGFFQTFITVKGIGPRKALRALAVPATEVAAAIERKDVAALVKLPQIGRRAAETIVAELGGKVGKFVGPGVGPVERKSKLGSLSPAEADAVDTLVALGERRADAESLLERLTSRKDVPTDTDGLVAEMLRLRGGR